MPELRPAVWRYHPAPRRRGRRAVRPAGVRAALGTAGVSAVWGVAGTVRAVLGTAGVSAVLGVAAACVTTDGPGCGGSGCAGWAEAVAPANMKTPTVAAATLVAGVLQRRAFSFIAGGPFMSRSSTIWSGADCIHGEATVTRPGMDLQPCSDRPVMQPRPTRGRRRYHPGPSRARAGADRRAYTLFR